MPREEMALVEANKSVDSSPSKEALVPAENPQVDAKVTKKGDVKTESSPKDQKMPGRQPEVVMVRIDQIQIPDWRKKPDQKNVDDLAQSIQDTGYLINPVTVKREGLNLVLISGHHRLEACKKEGWVEIPASIVDVSYEVARILELDENLRRKVLNVLELGECLVERRDYYEKLHSKIKRGGDKRSEAARSKSQNDNLKSFSQDSALLIGGSESKVNRLVFIATKIVPEVRDLIRDHPVADSQTDLLELAKCDPVQQKKIARDLVEWKIESVRVAVEQLAKQEAETEPESNPVAEKLEPAKAVTEEQGQSGSPEEAPKEEDIAVEPKTLPKATPSVTESVLPANPDNTEEKASTGQSPDAEGSKKSKPKPAPKPAENVDSLGADRKPVPPMTSPVSPETTITKDKGEPEVQQPLNTGKGSGAKPKATMAGTIPPAVEKDKNFINLQKEKAVFAHLEWIEGIAQAAAQREGWDFVILLKNPARVLGSDMSETKWLESFCVTAQLQLDGAGDEAIPLAVDFTCEGFQERAGNLLVQGSTGHKSTWQIT